MKRRLFLQAAGATAVVASPSNLLGALKADNPYRKNIGIQLYTLRNEIGKDVGATIKAVVDAGYVQGEMYGFPNCDPMIQAAKDSGLALHSSHFEWDSVVSPKDEGMSDFMKTLEKANEVGLSHLVVPYLHGNTRETLDDYKKLAGNFNKAAVMAKDAGVTLAYHNHAFEFEPKEGGKTGFDVFTEEFGEEMKFELDVFWVKVGGVAPVKLMKKLKGRVSQLHLKDLKRGMQLPNFGSVPADAFQELGDGMIKMEPIIKAAAKVGVAHCHVEQDQSPDPIASIKQSMGYLKAL
ncbi:MAG: sugar phosphate isomerase/epimerase [Verrucomicrobiales bacterium]|nr:sugar phosphate isomerase/epimerase [Verrucomicrobiales bacterium]